MPIPRMAKDMIYKALNMPKYMASKMKSMVDDRMTAQKNFQNRKDNSNYNRSASYWAKNKN